MKKNEFDSVYNIEVQRILLSFLIEDVDVFIRCRNIIKDTYFDDQLRRTVRFILGHADEHKAIPNPALIQAKTGIEVQTLTQMNQPMDEDWFLEEITKFCRYKEFESIIFDSYDLLQKGEEANIETRVREAMMISLVSDLGTNYFENPKQRMENMLDKSRMVSTGWETLDHKLYGGFLRGGLNVFCGGSGSGKSLFLQNLALNWTLAGHVVVYFSLELSEELVANRIDSMITKKSTKEVFRSIDDSSLEIIMKSKKTTGRLTIKKMPEGSTTTGDLRAYLKEFQIRTGLKPDCIVIDYLDLMLPNNAKIDVSSLFVKDKFVSEEIRAFMYETKTFGATASQLNRQSIDKAGEYDQSHIAGGISKINTADNVMAIYAPANLLEKGEYVLLFLKTRTAAAVGHRISLKYDPNCMLITDMGASGLDIEKPSSREELKEEYKNNKTTNNDVKDEEDTALNLVGNVLSTSDSDVLQRLRQKRENGGL